MRTIERVLQRNGVNMPRVRAARPARSTPARRPEPPNRSIRSICGAGLPQGRSHRYSIRVGKFAFDGAVCLRLAGSRRRDEVLWLLGECWKDLGLPAQVQLDNARELAGGGPGARTLLRMIRLCLRYGVSPVFIPEGEPPFNGSVENFNGWFQEPLFQ